MRYASTARYLCIGFSLSCCKDKQKTQNNKNFLYKIWCGERHIVSALRSYILFFQNSHWDRYLGMTAAMTQVPVPPTAANLEVTNCDLQFRQDGITSATLCFYRTRGCYAKWDPEF